jgi:putative heme-binding domain-containing protein
MALADLAFGQLGRVAAPTTANPLARDAKAVAAGEKSFQQLCTSCHGRSGEGGQGEGKGPNLMNSWEVRRASDNQLASFIRNGIAGTAMPAFALPDETVRDLAAFVRSLNAPANRVPLAGDVKHGAELFSGKGGCNQCHMVRGHGGFLGPDLTEIGARRRMGELRTAVLKPETLALEGFRAARLKLPNGRSLKAIIKQQSNWSMVVLDETGQLHLLHDKDMESVIPQSKQWMPSAYGDRLSPAEIQDLLAFLSRQPANTRANLEDKSSAQEPN